MDHPQPKDFEHKSERHCVASKFTEMEEGQDDNALLGSKPLSFKKHRAHRSCCLLVSPKIMETSRGSSQASGEDDARLVAPKFH